MIETSQLQTLIKVAEAQSFSRAATELNVTQSAISQSVKNLENKIGVELFKRLGKRVVLTPEGEKLHTLASSFLGRLDDTIHEIQHDSNTMSGKIRIGTVAGIGKSWLAPELRDFSLEYPKLEITIKMGFQDELAKRFEKRGLDFLVLPEDDLPQIGEREFLSEEKSILVFPKSKEYDIDENITLNKLSSYSTILFGEDDYLYLNWCRKRFGQTPKKVKTRYIINSHGSMLQAVSQGLGVAVVPTHVLKRSYYRDKVKNLGTEFEVTNGRFYLIYHKDSLKIKRIKTIKEKLVQNGRALISGLWV